MLVVVERPPLLIGGVAARAVAGGRARLPEERPAFAREGRDLEFAVAIDVADRGRHLQPAAGELRPALRLGPFGSVGMELVEARAVQELTVVAGANIGNRRLRNELEVVGGARVRGDALAGIRIPGLDDVGERQV